MWKTGKTAIGPRNDRSPKSGQSVLTGKCIALNTWAFLTKKRTPICRDHPIPAIPSVSLSLPFMHQRRRSPLVALPLIAITLIAFGMTRAAFAATPSSEGSQPSSTISRMLKRVANRAALRKNVSANANALHGAASQSSSRRSMSRSSSAVSTASIDDARTEIIRLVNIERAKEDSIPLRTIRYLKARRRNMRSTCARKAASRTPSAVPL
jgi:hypothetical protein